jgi:hypothetical protein
MSNPQPGRTGTARTAGTTGSTPYGQEPAARYQTQEHSVAAAGFTGLAAVLMILSGLWSFFVGITGILKGAFYLAVPNYTVSWSSHGWGWTHLILGAVVFAAGVCLLLGMMWARVVGVALAVLSALANFMFLPHYPLWSIIVIAIDLFIIWALTAGTRRQRA